MNIRSSNDSFRKLRESGAYYIDKTEMLETYLNDKFEDAVLFARPRRFGKTMTMTMFRDFLDIRQDSKAIFAGLEIMKHKETVEKYMNKYPVVFLSLKEVYGTSFENTFNNLRFAVSNICMSFDNILQSERIDEDDKTVFRTLKQQLANETNTVAALHILSRILKQHFGEPVFIIIDEYDVPMAKALNTPAYDQTRDMIEHMLSYVCKTNENVKAVFSPAAYTQSRTARTQV